MQSTVRAAGHDMPWHEVDQERQEWNFLEAEFVRHMSRTERDLHPTAGRWMMAEVDVSDLHLDNHPFSASTSASMHT